MTFGSFVIRLNYFTTDKKMNLANPKKYSRLPPSHPLSFSAILKIPSFYLFFVGICTFFSSPKLLSYSCQSAGGVKHCKSKIKLPLWFIEGSISGKKKGWHGSLFSFWWPKMFPTIQIGKDFFNFHFIYDFSHSFLSWNFLWLLKIL